MTNTHSVFQPDTQDELAQFVTENAANSRRRLQPIGGGTACRCGIADDGVEVRLDKLSRVIDYPARDMTITVEAGIRMAELGRRLKAENQRLPIDVPQAEQATLGGVIATNWSGSRRLGCGTMRDYVIGISAIDASGREFKGGGRVVKNVAGYDLCKLLVGSRGTLAIITQVTLKLRPMLETSALVRLTFDSLSQIDAVLNRLLTSATRPVAIDVLSRMGTLARPSEGTGKNTHPTAQLIVGFEGASRETSWQVESLLTECRPFEPRVVEKFLGTDAIPLWETLRDFSISSDSLVTFKASLLASRTCDFLRLTAERGIAAQAHAGNGIVLGHLPINITTEAQAERVLKPLCDLATSCAGSLTVLRCPDIWTSFSQPSGGGTAGRQWSEQVQRQLDPRGLFRR